MNQDIAMWMIGEFIVIGGGCIAAYVSIVQRLTRLETKWEDTMDNLGTKVAKRLHSPTDHHGIDKYLDKYLTREDLTLQEWQELKDKCEEIENDPRIEEQEKTLAMLMGAICEHKMKAYVQRSQSESEGLVEDTHGK